MTISAQFSARSTALVDGVALPNEVYQHLLAALRSLPAPWGGDTNELPPSVDFQDLCWTTKLRHVFAKGISGDVVFCYPRDEVADTDPDNSLLLRFNPKRFALRPFVYDVAPIFISALGAYRSEVVNEDWLIDLAEQRERVRHYASERCDVYRIAPAQFMDSILTRRAFSMDPDDIRRKLVGHVPDVRLIADGVYIIGSDVPLDGAASEMLDTRLRALLGVPKLP